MRFQRVQHFADRLTGVDRAPTLRAGWAKTFAGAEPVEPSRSPIGLRRTPQPHRPGLAERALRALRDIYALARHAEPRGSSARARDAALDSAQATADVWRRRAEEAEQHAGALETRLADAETTALDLRSRLICLQGKLAATHATARYQSLALALEHGRHDDALVAEVAFKDAPRRRPD